MITLTQEKIDVLQDMQKKGMSVVEIVVVALTCATIEPDTPMTGPAPVSSPSVPCPVCSGPALNPDLPCAWCDMVLGGHAPAGTAFPPPLFRHGAGDDLPQTNPATPGCYGCAGTGIDPKSGFHPAPCPTCRPAKPEPAQAVPVVGQDGTAYARQVGRGSRDCIVCGGPGYRYLDSGEKERCPSCNRSGEDKAFVQWWGDVCRNHRAGTRLEAFMAGAAHGRKTPVQAPAPAPVRPVPEPEGGYVPQVLVAEWDFAAKVWGTESHWIDLNIAQDHSWIAKSCYQGAELNHYLGRIGKEYKFAGKCRVVRRETTETDTVIFTEDAETA